ncbi:MAG: hypothetical protein K0M48_11610 [Thiobacillus sp.]|nr:hypothetical protein [Thiobacillus sp.]
MDTDIDEGNRKQFNDGVKDEVPSRRVVLRGALAVGCGLLLPAALFGCDSKKGESSTGAAPNTGSAGPDSSPTPSADAAAPASTGKMTQASVQYQTQPKGEQKCGGCLHFIAESNSCKLVEGQISPDGWCSLWAQKA